MFLRFLVPFFCFSFVILLSACRGDESIISDNETGVINNEWTDSIFGSLTDKQQFYQHLIIELPKSYQSNLDSLVKWVAFNEPYGLKFIDWNPDTISNFKAALDTLQFNKPTFTCDYFETLDLKPYPYWEVSKKNQSIDLLRIFQKSNYGLIDFSNSLTLNKVTSAWLDTMKSTLGLSPIIAHFDDENPKGDFNNFLNTIQGMKHNIFVEVNHLDSVNFNQFRKAANFTGLYIVDAKPKKKISLLQSGADLVISSIESGDLYANWKGPKNADEFNASTKRLLNLKSKMTATSKKVHLEADIQYTRLNLAHNATCLLKNKSNLIPIKTKFTVFSDQDLKMSQKVRVDNRVSFSKIELTEKGISQAANLKGTKVFLLSDKIDKKSLNYLSNLKADAQSLICFTNPDHYAELSMSNSLLFVPFYNEFNSDIFVQQLTARIDLKGNFVADSIIPGNKISASQLARTVPEFTGLDADTLAQINWAVSNAMNGMAFPGCQVLLAKNGCIIYDKQFGYHTYSRQKAVTEESMYDLASLTKVVATTMVGMKLYEMGAYRLKDSLAKYLPDSLKFHLPYPSTIRNITFEELFVHQSGMPAGFPIIRYMQYTSAEVGRFDKYYCDRPDTSYTIEVAENFFLEKEYGDSMWLKLNQIWLDKSKPYKYSDVNMNTLYMLFKSIIQSNPKAYGFNEPAKKLKEKDLFVEFLYNTYYKPLGMERTRYKPLRHYNTNSIVPTEDESYWRKQLLQGHVHDPNAALMGGIAGNAGMFSTTNDLAILCQMMLNKGVYNNQRFLKEETVTKFTSAQETSTRGLGFNKKNINTSGYGMADSCSLSTFGHTGFTGTCFWIDPESDLIYIFLANRVYPKVNNRIYGFNIRKRIHNFAYDARLNN